MSYSEKLWKLFTVQNVLSIVSVWIEKWTSHSNSVISSSFDPLKIDLTHEPTVNSFITLEQQCYNCYLFTNKKRPPILFKQFNTIHFVQLYMVRNNLYTLFFLSLATTSPYCIYFPRAGALKKHLKEILLNFPYRKMIFHAKILLT